MNAMEPGVQLSTKASDYKLIRLIGKGFGDTASIHLAKHVPSNLHVALKIFHLELLDQQNIDFALIQHELVYSRQLQHEAVLGSLCTFTTGQQIWSAMPVYGYGSCKDLLCAHFSLGLPEAAIAYILYDVIRALEYLHMRGIIHRSVKASHILISSEGRVSLSGLRHCHSIVKHGGLSSRIHEFPPNYVKTLLWAAPEVLQQNLCGYTTSSDVYSVGITACELANGAVPFADVDTTQMLLDKLKGVTPRLWDCTTIQPDETLEDPEEDPMLPYMSRQFSPHFHDFIDTCMRAQPHQRPTCTELLQHSFFKQVRRKSSLATTPLPELLHPVQPVMDILKQLGDEPNDPSEEMLSVMGDLEEASIAEDWDF